MGTALQYKVEELTQQAFPKYDDLDEAPYMIHGDVQLHAVNEIPKTAKYKESNEIVRGNGGHAHVFVQDLNNPTALIFTENDEQWVMVLRPTALDNKDRHDAMVVPRGLYKVVRTEETDHIAQIVRVVVD
jgi:hypothetical protein